VFSDFHLFDRLYGLRPVPQAEVDALLEGMEIRNKVSVVNDRFSTLNLSGGQRKRVALVVALLEDRPIFILDEWAADQDPQFRRKFYTEILPDLKRRGHTVLAVTHDDQYFHLADRHIRMEYGRMSEMDQGAAS
jgi:putative pyoverdin transport system ATP-binding/permease protein